MVDAPVGPRPAPGVLAYGLVAALSFFASSNFLFTKLALEGYAPDEVSIGKLMVGALVLLVPAVLGRQLGVLDRSRLLWGMLLGLVGYAIPQVTLAWAQQRVDTSVAALFLSCLPLFTLLLARVLLKEPIGIRKWVGFVIGFAGLLIMADPAQLVVSGGMDQALAYVSLMVSCLFFASSSIIVQKMPRMPVLQTVSLGLVFGSLFLVPFAFLDFVRTTGDLIGRVPSDLTVLRPLAGLVLVGVLIAAVSQVLRVRIIQTWGSAFFSVVGYIVPVWAAILGFIVFGEAITLRKIVAFVVICLGLLLAQSRHGPPRL